MEQGLRARPPWRRDHRHRPSQRHRLPWQVREGVLGRGGSVAVASATSGSVRHIPIATAGRIFKTLPNSSYVEVLYDFLSLSLLLQYLLKSKGIRTGASILQGSNYDPRYGSAFARSRGIRGLPNGAMLCCTVCPRRIELCSISYTAEFRLSKVWYEVPWTVMHSTYSSSMANSHSQSLGAFVDGGR